MSLVKTELLNDLFRFTKDFNYQLMEEYMREPKQYREKMPFAAFCILFYARLNELTDQNREKYDDGGNIESVCMD